MPVLLFALAEGPQPSPISHLQDGGGSFNLTSREEFVLLSLISPEVRGNGPWEAGHWLTPGVSRDGLSVAEVSAASKLPEVYLGTVAGRAEFEYRPRLCRPCFLGLIYQWWFRVESNTVC